MHKHLLSCIIMSVVAVVAACGEAAKDKAEETGSTNTTPKAISDTLAQVIPDGGTWSAKGVCTPYYVQILSSSNNERGYASRDTSITFTLASPSDLVIALYSDADCKTKVTEDVSATHTSESYTATLAAGNNALAVYFLASEATPTGFMSTASLGIKSSPIPIFNDLSDITLSIGTTANYVAMTKISVNETPKILINGCARLQLFAESNSDSFEVSDKDVAINFSFVSGSNAKIYSDPKCASAITSTAVKTGTVSVSVFVKDDVQETVTLNYTAPDLGVNSNLNLGLPVGDPTL